MNKKDFDAAQVVPTFNLGILDDIDDDSLVGCAELIESETFENVVGIDKEVNDFINSTAAKSTKYKEVSAEKRFIAFVKSLNENDTRKIEEFGASSLIRF